VKPLSLRWRLSLLVILVLIAGFAVIALVAYWEMDESMQRDARQTLAALMTAALGSPDESDSDAGIQAELESIVRATTRRESTRYRFWWDDQPARTGPVDSPETHEIFRQAMAAVEPPQVAQHIYCRVGRGKQAFGVVWARKTVRGRIFNVQVAYSNRYAYNEMREFRNIILILGGAVALATGIATSLVILAGLRPIGRTARIVANISARNMDRSHLDSLPVPGELKLFVQSLSDMLERLHLSMQAQRRFTADASHELRTPLAVAKSTLQAVRNRPRDAAEYEHAIDEVLLDLRRMERLVAQLLTLARLDNTPHIESPKTVRLDVVAAKAAAAETANLGAPERLALGTLAAVSVPGEEGLLTMMVGNLVRNALVHGPSGGTVTVSVEGDDGEVRLGVHDEGGAIPAGTIEKLFERFYRMDASRSCDTGGTGLGLALAREIARLHGGDVSLTSSPAGGTTFTVRLPRETPDTRT